MTKKGNNQNNYNIGLFRAKKSILAGIGIVYGVLFILWVANVLNVPIFGIGAVEWFGRQPMPIAAMGRMTWVMAPDMGSQAVKYHIEPAAVASRLLARRTLESTANGGIVYEVNFLSDSEVVYGVLGVPSGIGPFPGVVVCHPSDSPYQTGLHTQDTVKWLAQHGVFAFAPDYRGWGRSEGSRGNEVRDVWNALATLEADERVDTSRLGLIGYSMGGGIAARAAAARPDLKLLVLYYPQMMGSVEELKEVLAGMGGGERSSGGVRSLVQQGRSRGADDLEIEYTLRMISPIYHLDSFFGMVALFHGAEDNIVSVRQSRALADERYRLGLPVELHEYPMTFHAFANSIDNVSREDLKRTLEAYLLNPQG